MEGIKYVNLKEIGPVVIEIWGVENGDLAVPVNNSLVCCTSFLAADTWSCVLIYLLSDYFNSFLQPALATVSSNTCTQMHVQIKHSLAYVYMCI